MTLSEATRRQNSASSPAGSAWVGANAGSGKTRVLTDRVARLLLHGARPERILCLTYTKAAAAEMKIRLFRRLGAWSMMPDEKLREELAQLEEVGDVDLVEARRLFARALETPGELKIQTIHAFCGTILRRFPLEAGVSPNFREMDDRATRVLRDTLLDEIALEAPEIFAAVAAHLTGDGPDKLVDAVLAKRDAFAGDFEADALADEIGIRGPAPVVADADAAFLMQRLADAMTAAGTPSERAKTAPKIANIARHVTAEDLEGALLFGAGAKAAFQAKRDKFATKGTLAALDPADLDAINELAERVQEARADRLARALVSRTRALHDFARVFLDRYDRAKAAEGFLDFDDLILRTRALLTRTAMAPWVLYKLDGGIEHILVDEAQDTSPLQWDVIEALAAEFHAGEGAEGAERTLFVVGDEKQSIYSFQGAQPAKFGRMREVFADRMRAVERPFGKVALDVSFRSAPPILAVVDEVFATPQRGGVSDKVVHAAYEDTKPGRVDLWPFLETDTSKDDAPWWTPQDMPSKDRADLQLARIVASQIAEMLERGTLVPSEDGPRPIVPGDILILLRTRGVLFHALIGHLKDAGVPIAGADRVKLGEELAVKDLLALMRWAVTPDDDLSLAAVLRSPLFDVSEDRLYRIAHGRGTARLLTRLQADPTLERVAEELQQVRDSADFVRPYEFLDRILTRLDGRRRLIARLGPPAIDGIDELLAQAIAYERAEPPTLTGFLDWLEPDTLDIKRELGESADAVRIMTVHGAKGLESPVVILPDTARQQEKGAPPVVLDDADRAIWQRSGGTEFEGEVVDGYKARIAEERERLLYVALTRAEHWLIVAGAGSLGKPEKPCWYQMVETAMAGLPAQVAPPIPGLEGAVQRLDSRWTEGEAPVTSVHVTAAPLAPPDWGTLAEPERPAFLSPSRLGGAHALPGEGEETERALLRGDVTHALLELPAGADPATAPDLDRLPVDMRDAVLAEVAALRADPAMAMLFGPEAMSEVPVSGRLGEEVVLGRIDRIVVQGDRVLIVDFKSNRVVPDRVEDTPESVLRQMGAYLAVLTPVFPGRTLVPAVVWTAAGRLDALPHELVNAALARAGFP